MTIEEVREAKQALEICIAALITDFCDKTGLCIDEMELRMTDVGNLSDTKPHNMLYQVIVSVGL